MTEAELTLGIYTKQAKRCQPLLNQELNSCTTDKVPHLSPTISGTQTGPQWPLFLEDLSHVGSLISKLPIHREQELRMQQCEFSGWMNSRNQTAAFTPNLASHTTLLSICKDFQSVMAFSIQALKCWGLGEKWLVLRQGITEKNSSPKDHCPPLR